jgi:hypothetical protein
MDGIPLTEFILSEAEGLGDNVNARRGEAIQTGCNASLIDQFHLRSGS